MTERDFTIRLAQLDELAHASAIDAAAGQLFTEVGLGLQLEPNHPFARAELERWREAARRSSLYWAMAEAQPVGFHAVGEHDGHGYLEQLAVRPEHGRRGIGRALVEHAIALCRSRGQREVWLTTYDHVAWNAPFYERLGFTRVPAPRCGPELREILASQRRILPDPEHRIAMHRPL